MGSLWQHWGPLFCDKRVRTLKIEVFSDVCFKVTFLDDFRSDSGVPGTLKTSIWRERGCKNQFFTEIGILMILGSVLEVILEAKGGLGPHFERLLVTLGSILVYLEGT